MGNVMRNSDNTDIDREERGRGGGVEKTAEPEFLKL